jgi:hypothetical protein
MTDVSLVRFWTQTSIYASFLLCTCTGSLGIQRLLQALKLFLQAFKLRNMRVPLTEEPPILSLERLDSLRARLAEAATRVPLTEETPILRLERLDSPCMGLLLLLLLLL